MTDPSSGIESIPIVHVAVVVSGLVAALAWQTKRAAAAESRNEKITDAYLAFSQSATPILESVRDLLKEMRNGKTT